MSLSVLLSSERKMSVTMGLVFLPWMAAVLYTGGAGLPLTSSRMPSWFLRPAVVTDVGRTAELCGHNETGFVAAAATVSSFSDALERAWERREDWLRMGQAARARAEKLIPKHPIGEFCERLKACASAKSREREDSSDAPRKPTGRQTTPP